MKLRILIILAITSFWASVALAQNVEHKVLDYPDLQTNPVHHARKSIKILPGYSRLGTTARYYIDEKESFDTDYSTDQNDYLNMTLDKELDVGMVTGQASVSLGGASYGIKLMMPGASGKLLPQVQLLYNHNGPNNILGIGWGLTGLSSVSRANRDFFHDGKAQGVKLTSEDALVLDGNRLVSTSTNIYKTESENFAVITAMGTLGSGAAWFKVVAKDGMEYEYGNTADSKLMNHAITEVVTWRLNKIKDNYGNYITFKYYGNRDTRIDEISYGGNANISTINTIKFLYDNRADKNTVYSGGASMAQNHLLRSIKITTQGIVYSRYDFTYGYDGICSYLKEVTEFSTTESNHRNSTRFKYESQPVASQYETMSFVGSPNTEIFAGDFNGDGYADMVEAFYIGTSAGRNYTQIKVHTRNASGGYTQAIAHSLLGTDYQVYMGNDGKTSTNRYSFQTVDYNGDGRDDIVVYSLQPANTGSGPDPIHNHFKVLYTNASVNGFDEAQYNAPKTFKYVTTANFPYMMNGDFNGDSKPDVLYFLSASQGGIAKAFITEPHAGVSNLTIADVPVTGVQSFSRFNTADQLIIVDHDGDGKSEVMVIRETNCTIYEIYKVSGAYYAKAIYSSGYPTSYHNILTGDFNGDGKTDLYTYVKSSGTQSIAYSRGNGDGYNETSFGTLNTVTLSDVNMTDYIVIADYNGDGKSDLLHAKGIDNNSSRTDVYYSRGVGFKAEAHIFPRWIDPFGFSFIPCDIDGDGRTNLLYPYTLTPAVATFRKNGKERFLQQVFDGNGQHAQFIYQRLNEDAVFYTKATNATFPVNDYNGAMYLVSAFVASDGLGGYTQSDFKYTGAKLHRQGRGMMGFLSATESNAALKYKTVQEFELNTTFGLMLARKNKSFTFQNNPVKETVFTNVVDALPNGRYYPKVTTVTETNGLSGNVNTTVNTFDANGNVVTKSVSIAGGLETQLSTFAGFSAIYPSTVPALPQTIVNTSGRQGESNFTSISTILYNTRGSITSKTEFDGLAKKLVTTYGYDNAGNVISTTMSASGIATQTETYEYDATKRYMVKQKNSLNQQSLFEYDPVLGLQTRSTTPDGQTVTHQYDVWSREIASTNALGITCDVSYGWMNSGDIQSNTDVLMIGYYAHSFQLKSTANGAPLKTIYDMFGRTIRTETVGLNNKKVYYEAAYNVNGSLSTSTSPYLVGSSGAENVVLNMNIHDDYNRVTVTYSQDMPLYLSTNTSLFAYTYTGGKLTVAITAPDQKVTSKKYDGAGRLIEASDNGGLLEYAYYSHGGIRQVKLNGAVTASMEYDEYARQKKLTDKDAGVVMYDNDALGRVISQTDALNKTYTTAYDALGRVYQMGSPSGVYTYTYVASGNGMNKLKKMTAPNGDYYEYEYDAHGRVINEKKNITGQLFTRQYEFDFAGRPSLDVYPGGFSVRNEYDAVGNLIKIKRGDNGQMIWQALQATGLGALTSYKLGNNITTAVQYHPLGYCTRSTTPGVQDFSYSFNTMNGNLDTRTNMITYASESFGYDVADRLEYAGGTYVSYNANGNVTSKSDMGNFTYHPIKTDAVVKIDNYGGLVSGITQNITYTPFNKTATITEGDYALALTYGADEQRSKSVLSNLGLVVKTRYYFGNYEKQVQPATTTEIVYISAPTGLCAMYVKENGQASMYYVYTDHLGSITTVTNGSGTVVARQSFDAWGRKRNPTDWSMYNIPSVPGWLYRGYTGHEHLPEFDLVNMNGRMYDPVLGSMLGPDNYTQLADNTQSYNRYAYCLNNPLKYTDPTGEIFWVPVIIVSAMVAGAYFNTAAVEGSYNPTKWRYNNETWGAMIVGGVKGGVAAGVSLATSGMFTAAGLPFASTVGTATGSYAGSGGTSIGFGFASYNFGSGEFSSLFSWGANSTVENVSYMLGTLLFMSEVFGMLNPPDVTGKVSTDNTEILKGDPGHIKWDANDFIDLKIDFGPEGHNRLKSLVGSKGTNSYNHIEEQLPKLELSLNKSVVEKLGKFFDKGVYSAGTGMHCAGGVSAAAMGSGYFMPNLLLLPLNAPQITYYTLLYQQQIKQATMIFNSLDRK